MMKGKRVRQSHPHRTSVRGAKNDWGSVISIIRERTTRVEVRGLRQSSGTEFWYGNAGRGVEHGVFDFNRCAFPGSTSQVVIRFATPMAYVSIDALDAGDNGAGLFTYNAHDQLIGQDTAQGIGQGNNLTLSVSTPGITSIALNQPFCMSGDLDGLGWDNLTFSATDPSVPEPSTLIMGLAAVIALAGRSIRRRQLSVKNWRPWRRWTGGSSGTVENFLPCSLTAQVAFEGRDHVMAVERIGPNYRPHEEFTYRLFGAIKNCDHGGADLEYHKTAVGNFKKAYFHWRVRGHGVSALVLTSSRRERWWVAHAVRVKRGAALFISLGFRLFGDLWRGSDRSIGFLIFAVDALAGRDLRPRGPILVAGCRE
jgi:hypothetical protein